MTYTISILFLLVNQLHMFRRKNGKKIALLFVLFCWILHWGSTKNPDYNAYLNAFESNAQIIPMSFEKGFIFLIKCANYIGISYQMFLFIWASIGFILIHKTIKMYTDNYYLVYTLYFIQPFFYNVVLVRNFFVMAILIYSTKYLLNNSKVKFCLLMLLASTIQSIAFLYIPFVFLNVNKKNSFIKPMIAFSSLISLFLLLVNKDVMFLLDYLPIEKLIVYFRSPTNYGFILFWGVYTTHFVMNYISQKLYTKYHNKNILNLFYYDTIHPKFIRLSYLIFQMSFVFFPLYILNGAFNRLSRNILIINYISIAITLKEIDNKKDRNRYILFIILYSIFIILYYVVSTFEHKNFENIIKPILENNILL